jgi:hypothetical protein
MMQDVSEKKNRLFWWGASVSVLLHLLAAAAFLFSSSPPKPPKEQAIQVEIVTQKPKEPKKEEPEPAKQEPPKSEPKPPEPKPPEAKTPEPDKPAPSPMPEQSAQQPAQGMPLPVLRPAFQFGEEDSGPDVSTDGDAAEGEAKPDPSDVTPDEQAKAAEPPQKPAEVAKDAIKTPGASVPDTVDLPKADMAEAAPPPGAKPVEKPEKTPPVDAAQTPDASQPDTKPLDAPKAPELTKARKLYSEKALGGKAVTAAMAGQSREMRVARLCSTELGAQLQHGTPAFRPEILPAPRVKSGTNIIVPKAAFRTHTAWYELSFRCEIDTDATKVVSFSYHVGNAIPRSEWKARGFPEN